MLILGKRPCIFSAGWAESPPLGGLSPFPAHRAEEWQDKAYSTRQKTANLQGKFRIPPRKICIPIRIQILATTRVRHSGGLGAQPSTSPVCGDSTRQKTANLQGKFRIPPRKICIPIRIQILATTRVRHSGGLGAQPSTSPVCGDTMGMQCIPMCVPAYGTCPNTPYREDLQTRCFSTHLFDRGNPEEKENTDSLFFNQNSGV